MHCGAASQPVPTCYLVHLKVQNPLYPSGAEKSPGPTWGRRVLPGPIDRKPRTQHDAGRPTLSRLHNDGARSGSSEECITSLYRNSALEIKLDHYFAATLFAIGSIRRRVQGNVVSATVDAPCEAVVDGLNDRPRQIEERPKGWMGYDRVEDVSASQLEGG